VLALDILSGVKKALIESLVFAVIKSYAAKKE